MVAVVHSSENQQIARVIVTQDSRAGQPLGECVIECAPLQRLHTQHLDRVQVDTYHTSLAAPSADKQLSFIILRATAGIAPTNL